MDTSLHRLTQPLPPLKTIDGNCQMQATSSKVQHHLQKGRLATVRWASTDIRKVPGSVHTEGIPVRKARATSGIARVPGGEFEGEPPLLDLQDNAESFKPMSCHHFTGG